MLVSTAAGPSSTLAAPRRTVRYCPASRCAQLRSREGAAVARSHNDHCDSECLWLLRAARCAPALPCSVLRVDVDFNHSWTLIDFGCSAPHGAALPCLARVFLCVLFFFRPRPVLPCLALCPARLSMRLSWPLAAPRRTVRRCSLSSPPSPAACTVRRCPVLPCLALCTAGLSMRLSLLSCRAHSAPLLCLALSCRVHRCSPCHVLTAHTACRPVSAARAQPMLRAARDGAGVQGPCGDGDCEQSVRHVGCWRHCLRGVLASQLPLIDCEQSL